jgi:tetratricopeptide (TPR) repeat protein
MGFWRKDVIQPALGRELAEAEAEQWAILARDGDNAHAYFALGALAFLRGDRWGAVSFYRRALELSPSWARAHVELGRVYVVQGLYDRAWKHAQEAEKLGDRSLVEQLERYPEVTQPPRSS